MTCAGYEAVAAITKRQSVEDLSAIEDDLLSRVAMAICKHINPDAIALRLVDPDTRKPDGMMIASTDRYVRIDETGKVVEASHPAKDVPETVDCHGGH